MHDFVPETAIDISENYRRGGKNYGDEDFALFKCPTCGRIYLFEYEVDTVYLSPDDLSIRVNVFDDSFDCLECGSRIPDEPWIGPKARPEFGVTWPDLSKSRWSWVTGHSSQTFKSDMATLQNDEILREHGQRILDTLRKNRSLSTSDLRLVLSIHEMGNKRALRMIVVYGILLLVTSWSLLLTEWLLGIKAEVVNLTLVGGLFLAFAVQFIWSHSNGRDYHGYKIMNRLSQLTCNKCDAKMGNSKNDFVKSQHCPHCDATLREVFPPQETQV